MKQRQVRPDAKISNLITINISGEHVLMAVQGTVHLLHFEQAYDGHMRHYVGFTADGLDARSERHREGKGASPRAARSTKASRSLCAHVG